MMDIDSPVTPSSDPATDFPRFGELPSEIQHLIWQHAVHVPRLVYLWEQISHNGLSALFRLPPDKIEPPLPPRIQIGPDILDVKTPEPRRFTGWEWARRHQTLFERNKHASFMIEGEAGTFEIDIGPGMNQALVDAAKNHSIGYFTGIEEDIDDFSRWSLQLEYPSMPLPQPMTSFQQATIPPLLLASSGSNAVASEFYRRAFPTLGCLAETCFNFETDYLFIDYHSFWTVDVAAWLGGVDRRNIGSDFQKVQNLSVAMTLNGPDQHFSHFLLALLGTLGNVKRVSILVDLYPSQVHENGRRGELMHGPSSFNSHVELCIAAHARGIDIDFPTGEIDLDVFEHVRLENNWMIESGKPCRFIRWDMPEIRYATLTSNGMAGL